MSILKQLKERSSINQGYRKLRYKGQVIKYCYLVWNYHNRKDTITVKDGYVIHHKDGDSLNDKITNLVKMTHSDHSKLHHPEGRTDYFNGVSKPGKENGMYGKKHSAETRKRMSLARKGRPATMKGKHHTEETKKKISQSLSGRKLVKYVFEGEED